MFLFFQAEKAAQLAVETGDVESACQLLKEHSIHHEFV